MLSSLRNWSGWAAAADPSQWRPPTCRLLTQSLLCYLIFNQSLTSAAAASTSTADQTDLVNSNSSSSSSSSSSVSQAGNNDNHHSSPPATSLPPDFVSSLTPLLSPSAQILLPSSPSYRQYSLRFLGQEGAPNLLAVVLPTTEADVAAAVRFANSRRVPFLATSGQHGPWNPLSKFSGVGISLRNLETKISLVTAAAAAAGESGGNQQSLSQNQPKQQQQQHAIIGGGMSIRDTVRYLWDNQKETTTGLCECVGVVAPGLGGGHGLFQGRYGLGVDQYVSARLVLGSGQVVTASETENPDLWWGVRGAGQNLGIVTELKVKVYDVEPARRGWAWQGFTFGQDRVEDLYGWVNGFVAAKKQAVELVLWSVWAWDGVRKEPVINFMFIYNGPMTQLKNISQEIQKLGPVGTSEGVVAEYPDMAKVFGVSLDDRLCQKGNVNGILRSADVISYEIPALRKAMDLYGSKLKSEPALNSSVIILEGYSMQGVQAVPAESTAYAHREQRLLLAPNIFWPQNNATLDDIAQRWGRDLWKALSGTAQRRTYINYAWGDEGPQALYGYEPWRLQRLRTLKKKYDPQGRFGYYAWAG